MSVITRFPPSPTGYFHIGSARTALFNALFAAHEKGTMIMRFEDTDKERSKPEFEADILEGMRWLRIPFELAPVYRQSERTEVYRSHLKRLIDEGKAYEAEAAENAPDKKVIRFKNPNTTITFDDKVRGAVSFDTSELKDFVIAKGLDEPLYHLAVVIDDAEMGVTHVIRGEDHISNTPRQILILEALGFTRPQYAHIPLILAADRSKMSKRHGAVSMTEYRKLGFLPQAIVNYLALLGWNPGGDRELYDFDSIAEHFTFEHVHKSGAIFNMEKLRWFNREYLLRLPESEYEAAALGYLKEGIEGKGLPFDEAIAARLMPLVRERVSVWSDLSAEIAVGEYDYFFADPVVAIEKLPGKAATPDVAKQHLEKIHEMLAGISDEIFADAERLKEVIWDYATAAGRGAVLWPMRYALSGKEKSPDPFRIATIIGKDATLRRLKSAADTL